MDMTKEALQFMMERYAPSVLSIGEKTYTDKQLFRVMEPTPKAVEVRSLQAVVDFIEAGVDINEDIFVHVVNPLHVMVYGGLNDDQNRKCFINANAEPPKFRFGQWMDMETFIIALQAQLCEPDPLMNNVTDRAKVLQYVGTLREFHEDNIADDGVTQSATVKTGIATVGTMDCPNPVKLAPYRTFVEVEQPISEFVLRLKEGPIAALFEADGGAWEREAVANIKGYLMEALEPGDSCRGFNVCVLA